MEACKECQSLSWIGIDQSQPYHPKCTRHGTNAAHSLRPDLNAESIEKGLIAMQKLSLPRSDVTKLVYVEGPSGKLFPLSSAPSRMVPCDNPASPGRYVSDPPTDIPSLTAAMESFFTVGEEGTSATAVTGEPFITFSLGGRVAEGESAKAFATSEQGAVEGLYFDLIRHAQSVMRDRPRGEFTLYWREKPNIYTCKMYCHTPGCGLEYGYPPTCRGHEAVTIWCRLLISDKPPLAKES